MGERKVLNKYYPPDFDPKLLPRGRAPKDNRQQVRMMMPMSVQCTTCGEFIYRGKKFNSMKETVEEENYLGLKIFRFIMKCAQCSSEFTIKTDPKNADYTAERGCQRTFEPWRASENEAAVKADEEEAERELDVMASLEYRQRESKAEMDIIDGLDEIRALNARNSRMTVEQLLEAKRKRVESSKAMPDDLRAQAAAVFAAAASTGAASDAPTVASSSSTTTSLAPAATAGPAPAAEPATDAAGSAVVGDDGTKYLDDLDRLVAQKKKEKAARAAAAKEAAKSKKRPLPDDGSSVSKQKPKLAAVPAVAAKPKEAAAAISLFGAYDDSSSSS